MAADIPMQNNRIITFGPFRADVGERLLFENDEPIQLPGKAFDLLLALVQTPGHLRVREELIEALWPETIVEEANLTWNVNALRKALRDDRRNPRYVETVRGHGYRFVAPVAVEAKDDVGMGLLAQESPSAPLPAFGGKGKEQGSRAKSLPPGEDSGVGAVVPAAIATGTVAPTGNVTNDGGSEGVGGSLLTKGDSSKARIASKPRTSKRVRGKLAPTGALLALGAAAVIVIVGVLIWRFVPFGSGAKNKSATPVIAVMPFENLSSDPNNAYLAEGIQDTILSKLAGIGGLRIISRASTKRYPSHPTKLGKIATELGATAVLEGSVQKSGDRMMVNVQLIDVATNEHIWAHVYTRSLADVFAVESDVATQVATSLKTELLPGETIRLASKPTDDPQAYLLLLKANYYANQIFSRGNAKNSAAALARAVTLYHQAIAKDSQFALAYARLSLLKTFKDTRNYSLQTEADSKQAAKRALALDPNLPEARLAMAYAKYFLNGDLPGALAQLEQIPEQFSDDNAEISGAMALMYLHQGNWQKALAGYRRAITLDPRNPRWLVDIGITLTMLRHYPQAAQRFDQALALEPNDYYAAAFKAMMLLAAGKPLKQILQVVAVIPPTSTQKGLVPALQFEIAQLSRQPQAALNALKNASGWVAAPNVRGREPVALLRAQAWENLGDEKKAQQAYEKAHAMLQTALKSQPTNTKLWSFLGLAEAGLWQKAQAIAAGRKATSLAPVSKDAVEGPSHLVILAKIYARVGKLHQTIELLRRLLEMPAGIVMSVPLLERDPVWDPFRKSPQFQNLLKEFANKPPLPTSAQVASD